jgi:DNA-binding MarR family transcriptional regulator
MLTKTQSKERDMKVVEFISKIPCYSDTIQRLFYPTIQVANKHLKILYDYGYIKKYRKFAHERYFYYTKPKKHREHYDKIARTYYWFVQNDYEILDFKVQENINGVMPDLLLQIKQDNIIVDLPVEIEHTNIKQTVKKYQKTDFNNLILVSSLPTGIIESEYVKMLYNINFKELE